ncbi:hypothetical protein XENOCAPTIV_005146 [Xenoophorus captivus]|uniref:Large ribosomal subunit protein uL22m n=1 Tax=Xenoophorus captivus TaxID=1517983 RepID=A0ABV0QZV5_9TELE
MVLGSGKKLAVSPVWNQWQTTTPFSSPETTRFLSAGDQCTAETGFYNTQNHLIKPIDVIQHLAENYSQEYSKKSNMAKMYLIVFVIFRRLEEVNFKCLANSSCPELFCPSFISVVAGYRFWVIRGMSIDEAIAQLEFNDKKGAKIMKEVLLEAQEMAVKNHNVEYKSNLYVAESFSGKGKYLKRIRYHGRGMFGIMDKVYCHYFVKLVEGLPPKPEQKTSFDQAKDYVQSLKNRTIIHSL